MTSEWHKTGKKEKENKLKIGKLLEYVNLPFYWYTKDYKGKYLQQVFTKDGNDAKKLGMFALYASSHAGWGVVVVSNEGEKAYLYTQN